MKTPKQLAEERLIIADQYAKLGERKVQLKRLRAKHYDDYREDYTSDAGVKRAWERTEEGLELMEIKEKMKSKDHKMSALFTMIKVMESEARNQY